MVLAVIWLGLGWAGNCEVGGPTLTRSGNDLVLSFASTGTNYYGLQALANFPGVGSAAWANVEPGIRGSGAIQSLTLTNALLNSRAFYRVVVQSAPVGLVLSQADAFAVLGYNCGGIDEQVYATGFDPASGNPTGYIYLSTSCNGSGRGGHSTTYAAWVAVTWDLAGNVLTYNPLTILPPLIPGLVATDAFGDILFNAGYNSYLIVPVPAAASDVSAMQSGDQFQVAWTPRKVNPAAITGTRLTATPAGSPGGSLTNFVVGPATNGVIPQLQPATTYLITVANQTIGGTGPDSAPLTVTTAPASVAPSAATNVLAVWSNLNPVASTDTFTVTWAAADPGNSPVDQYQIVASGSDGGGSYTNTVGGSVLTTLFTVDWVPNWTMTVQAHNATGWGPVSTSFFLGGL